MGTLQRTSTNTRGGRGAGTALQSPELVAQRAPLLRRNPPTFVLASVGPLDEPGVDARDQMGWNVRVADQAV